MQLPYNRGMTQLALLLPFALPQKEMARDLLRELKTPALATLLGRGDLTEHQISDGFARCLPHEAWLARQFGLHLHGDSSPAAARNAMAAFGLSADDGVWFILQPVHLHIARDHLVLTDSQQLQLAEQDARALFEVVQPLFAETGQTLLYGDAQTWFLRADELQELQTSTPSAACGHNIDIWMPKGEKARDWRRLQNEVQMHWHNHPTNDAREMRGQKPVNSVWLWGGASSTDAASNHKFEEAFSLSAEHNPYIAADKRQRVVTSAAELLSTHPQHGLITLDSLIAPAMAGDWSEWLMRLQAMETIWFAPLLEAIKNNQLQQLSLTLSNNTALSTITSSKSSLRKFWRQSALTRLAP
ncbi:cofactor-independent phosphoglycerate mutase [compost metagenome]